MAPFPLVPLSYYSKRKLVKADGLSFLNLMGNPHRSQEKKEVQGDSSLPPFLLHTLAIRLHRVVPNEVLRGFLAARRNWHWITDLCSFRELAISVVFLSALRRRFGFQKESTGRSPNLGNAL